MITVHVLNEQIISAMKAEMAWQGLTQLDLAIRLDKRPEYVQRRLKGRVPLSVNDVEAIGAALGVDFIRPTLLHNARRAS